MQLAQADAIAGWNTWRGISPGDRYAWADFGDQIVAQRNRLLGVGDADLIEGFVKAGRVRHQVAQRDRFVEGRARSEKSTLLS